MATVAQPMIPQSPRQHHQHHHHSHSLLTMAPRIAHPRFAAPHALHFAIPILPTPTPPSLLKRQSSSSGSSSGSSTCSSVRASPAPRFATTSTSTTTPSPGSPGSPPLRPAARTSPASTAVYHQQPRRAAAAHRSPSLPPTPASTPLDAQPGDLSLPALELDGDVLRPIIMRRDTPRPSPELESVPLPRSRPRSADYAREINEFDSGFLSAAERAGLGIM